MKALIPQLNSDRLLLVVFIILLHVPNFLTAQRKKIGTLECLKSDNGIQGITLGADISTLNYSNLKYLDDDNKLDADSCLRFAISDTSVLKINNDLYLDMIGIRTYENKIVNIYLFFRKADAYILLHNFLSIYGVFTSKPIEYSNLYNWDSGPVSLSLMYQADVEDGVAVFTCNPLVHRITELKQLAAMRERKQTDNESAMLLSSTNP